MDGSQRKILLKWMIWEVKTPIFGKTHVEGQIYNLDKPMAFISLLGQSVSFATPKRTNQNLPNRMHCLGFKEMELFPKLKEKSDFD